MKYKLHGLCLESDMEFTGLAVAAPFDNVDVVFELRSGHGEIMADLPLENRTIAIPSPDKEWFVELFQMPFQSVMRFHAGLDFWINADGSHIVCRSYRDASPILIQQYLLGWVLSLVLHLKHMVGLHASSVVINDKAVGFAGSSRAGKSTLVTALAMAGCEVLTDEVLVFKNEESGIYATPGYREIRLGHDTVPVLANIFGQKSITSRESNGKLALQVDGLWANVHEEPLPLRTIYLLTGDEPVRSDKVAFSTLDPKDAPRHLLRHSFVIPKYYKEFLNRQFSMLCQLTSSIPVQFLEYPRDLDRLPQVVDAILEHENREANNRQLVLR